MKRQIIITLLALMAVTAFGQHDEQVTVEGKFRPKVNKVNKLQLQPETPQPSYRFPSSEVTPKDATQKFALDLEKIAPTAFAAKNDKLVTPTENFVMAGIGTRLSPIFLYKHNSMLTKQLGLGVGVKHNSSWLNIKDYAPSGYMNNAFEVNLTTSQFDGFQVDGGVFYKNDVYHYYGVNLTETPLTDEQIEKYCPRQAYNSIGGHIGLAPTSTRAGELSHSGSMDYQYTFDAFSSKEHFLGLDYGLGYTDMWWGPKERPQKVGVNVSFQYDGYAPAGYVENRIFFKVNPFFEMKDDFYRMHLGLWMDVVAGEELEDRHFALRPDLSGSLFVLDKKLEFYAGLKGGRKLMRFSEIVEDNPFVFIASHDEVHVVRNERLCFEGGVRTNIAEIVDLHVGVRYRHVDNDAFYVIDDIGPGQLSDLFHDDYSYPRLYNTYGIVYDETKTVSVLADARVKMRNSLTADLGLAYHSCSPAIQEYAWYRPTTEAKLKVTYDYNDKLAFNTTLLYQGGRYAKVSDDGPYWKYPPRFYAEKLKNVFDLSLGADYKVNDQITAFALIDNLAHQKYQLYYNYPVTGIQLFAGVKLKF